MLNTYEDKQKELKGIMGVIALNKRLINKAEREQIEALEYGLKERLKALTDECRMKEMDIKIVQFQKVLDILKSNKFGIDAWEE